MKRKLIEVEDLMEVMKEYQWLKYLAYGGGAIIGIWLLGKSSKLLTDAILNFKSLSHAIKH